MSVARSAKRSMAAPDWRASDARVNPRVAIGSIVAFFVGDFLNSYVLAKMKVRMGETEAGVKVLGINAPPVTIKNIENAIIERGFAEGWVLPEPPKTRTGKRVAVIGGGPAGMEAARVAARRGHTVTLAEATEDLADMRTVVLVTRMVSSPIILRVSFTIFISSLV